MLFGLKLTRSKWVNLNIEGLMVGLVVGLLIILFSGIFSKGYISWDNAFANIMFSSLISLSITNSIGLSAWFLCRNFKHQWALILAYYGGCIIGMVTGTEVSYLMMEQIFNVPYKFLGHPNQLAFNLSISVVVCTILYVYEFQKGRFKTRLQQHELEVLKLKQLKTQAELQTLQSKINPHFLYNSLNSIAGLIYEDAEKAEDMTLKLSKLFRYSINSQQENFASLQDELEVLNTYMDIEKVRFGDRITFSIEAATDLLKLQIPRFLIQPLVENALKHGLANTTKNGLLKISVTRNNKQLTVSVTDNGAAFPADLTAGYGLQSTYDKLSLLYQDDYQIQLINTPVKQISISFPII
jgi:two-component system, LytTR family, sensor kinase